MKIYEKMLKRVRSELSREAVENNEFQMSLYNLYEIANSEYSDFRRLIQNEKKFSNKELFRRPAYNQIHYSYGRDNMDLFVLPGQIVEESFYIRKEVGNGEFFIEKFISAKDEYIDKFIKKYYGEISEMFSSLQKYSTELYDFRLEINKFKVEYQDYVFEFYIDSIGNVNFQINIKIDAENKELYKKEYHNKESIIKIIKDSKYELAKRIKIDINTLDNSIVEVVNKYREKNNNTIKQ